MINLEDKINDYRNRMMKNIEEKVTQMRENHSISLKLIEAGFYEHEICSTHWNYLVHDRRSLSKLRSILGRLELYSKHPVSPTKIEVILKVAGKYNGFTISYYQDFVPGGRCKIENIAHNSLTLVCRR